MDRFENVTVLRKANIYYGGNVTSRTVLFADSARKTLGVILPGTYEFGTAEREHMEILAGTLRALLPGAEQWQAFGEGQTFDVPANSRFTVKADGVVDYCCSYLAG